MYVKCILIIINVTRSRECSTFSRVEDSFVYINTVHFFIRSLKLSLRLHVLSLVQRLLFQTITDFLNSLMLHLFSTLSVCGR